MITNILLPTDFSAPALNALNFAIDICNKTNAKLHVLHIKHIPVLDASFPAETYQLYLDEIEKTTSEGLQNLENDVLKKSNVKYELNTAIGFVNDEVQAYVKNNNTDLVVMGTKGASGLQEILIGSNTASVVGKSEVPVFVIPPSAVHADFKHILYSTDYNEPEFPSVSRLVYFAELYKSKITVLHVKTDFDLYFNSERNFFVRNKSNITYPDITVVNMEKTETSDAINKYVDEKGVDMVVLAKHNRSWFDRLFHRSFSKQMTYHTKVPLLVLNK